MKPNICVFHQSINHTFGGAASVTAWIMEALKNDYKVSLVTPDSKINVELLNYLYGTSFKQSDIEPINTEIPFWLKKVPNYRLKTLRLAYSVKSFKDFCSKFDLVINTANEIAIPSQAIHYIHYPNKSCKVIREAYQGSTRWLRLANCLIYKIVSDMWGNWWQRGSTIVANSNWTAQLIKRVYGVQPVVVYPPVYSLNDKYEEDQNRKGNGFLTIGRLFPEKRIHESIRIIDKVHAHFPDVHLNIVGFGSGQYAEYIKTLAAKRNYVSIHENISRKHLLELMINNRFGLHVTKTEHFGIAPAEMVSAGLLTFVHNSGGQVEIVDQIMELTFESSDDAVRKIVHMMKNYELQNRLRKSLKKKSSIFSSLLFCKKIRELTRSQISGMG